MERQNITLSLPKVLLKQAKALAAQEEKSLSQFMKESIENKIRERNGFSMAKKRQNRLLIKGFNLGTRGRIAVRREDLHVR